MSSNGRRSFETAVRESELRFSLLRIRRSNRCTTAPHYHWHFSHIHIHIWICAYHLYFAPLAVLVKRFQEPDGGARSTSKSNSIQISDRLSHALCGCALNQLYFVPLAVFGDIFLGSRLALALYFK